MIGAARRPRFADWWQRIQAQPGFYEALSIRHPIPSRRR